MSEETDLRKPDQIQGHIPRAKLEDMLEEIAEYSVDLPEDPTLPELGMRHLRALLAKCRQYTNRAQYYLQVTRRYEKNLRAQIRLEELSLELRMASLLADDVVVRQGPSVDDRKALAITQLRSEHENLAMLRVEHSNLEETVRIIKLKYDDLNRSNQDIKLQRQMVREDQGAWTSDGKGYEPPQARQDGTVPGGLAPPVRSEPIDPSDLLDPSRRPDDLPPPKDAVHAKQVAAFFSRPSFTRPDAPPAPPPVQDSAPAPEQATPAAPARVPEPARAAPVPTLTYDDILAD